MIKHICLAHKIHFQNKREAVVGCDPMVLYNSIFHYVSSSKSKCVLSRFPLFTIRHNANGLLLFSTIK